MMSGSPMEWSGRFMGKIKDLTSILKNLVGINVKNPDYLPEEDKHILNAGLMNLFDASVDMKLIRGAAINFIYIDRDSSFNLPAKLRNFIEKIEESQDGEEFLRNKTRLALMDKLSDEETRYLLDTWNIYYQSLQRKINEQFNESNYSAEYFSIFRNLLNGPKFKDTPLGRRYASTDNKKEFIENLIKLKTFDGIAQIEELSILSHAWREISGTTSNSGYITSEEAEKIADKYKDEMLEYGNLIEDYVTRYPDYFNEEATSQIKGFLKINKIKEAAGIAAREIYLPYFHYAFHYDGWVTDYRRYVDLDTLIRPIKPSLGFSAELDDLADEIKENLSKYPIFLKGAKIIPEKKGQDAWEAVEKNLRAVDKGLHILKNTKSIFELFKDLPDIYAYLYARARTAKEETNLNKLKNEVSEYSYNNINRFDLKEFEEYVSGAEPRDIMLALIKIALVCAKEAGADSKEFRKWQGKAQALAKQFQPPAVSSSLAIEQYKELIEQAFNNYESGGRKLPEYLQKARVEIQELFSHSSIYKLLTDAAGLIRENDPKLETMGNIYIALTNSAQAIDDDIFGLPRRNYNPLVISTPKNKSSSALASTAPVKTGGIDFREMSILTKPMGSFSGLNFNLPLLSKAELESFNLDAELADIQKMVNSAMVPSGNRLKEYLWACHQKGELDSRRDDIIISLAEICGLEESLAKESDPDLREALVMAEWI